MEHIVHIAEHFNELENTSGSSDGKENERVVSVDAFKNSTLLLSKIIMIHNASLPSTQGYVTMSNRLINLLARLLSTQFVQVRCQDLFELLFDVLNTIRGGYGFSLATLPVSTEEEENTHGSRSARNSVSGPSGQTAITIPPRQHLAVMSLHFGHRPIKISCLAIHFKVPHLVLLLHLESTTI